MAQESLLPNAEPITIYQPDSTKQIFADIRHLVKQFGKHEVVKDISFTMSKGEIFGLLGPNGAGKSTTINMLCGYLQPTTGEIVIDGLSTQKDLNRVKRLLGVVPQELALYQDLTPLENLNFFGSIYGLSHNERQQRAEEALRFVGLYDRRKEAVKTFSGGMQRRVNLAIALIHQPSFLLMDEPTVGIDPQSRENIFDTIEQLRARGTTILYTTHYMEEAERLCDRIAIMDEGRIIALGTLEQLLALREQQRAIQHPHGLQELFIQLTGKTLRD
jgi:ABC-2 type transport system ATP-binding protein